MNTPIPNHSTGAALRSRHFLSLTAAGLLAAVVAAGALPLPTHAQGPGHDDFGRPRHDILIEPGHAGHFYGPNHEEFFFVREAPRGRLIGTRAALLDLLLHPAVDAVAWGLGDVATLEVASTLGLPLHTTLYAVEPGVPVYASLPPGYALAQPLPENVALVASGPAGPAVLVSHVPPGAYVAYQTTPAGVVLSECIVVPPPVLPAAVMPTVTSSAPPVVMTPAPAVASAPAPVAPAPAPTTSPAPTSGKQGKIVYGADGKPAGVIILNADGTQNFVPLQ